MNLDERKKRILSSIVEDYILSAEPVGSKSIAEKYEQEFSSATIRNDMKLLEDGGYLEQPHVSSGRVPSTKGYRYYVDNLMKDNTLTMIDVDYINNNIVSYGDLEATLENAALVISKVLSLPTMSHLKNTDVVENIKILKISEKILLIILMSKSGTVKDVIVKITDSFPKDRIDELSKVLNQNLKGTPLENLPKILGEVVGKELEKFSEVLKAIESAMKYEIGDGTSSVNTDVESLLEQPEFSKAENIKKLFNVINTKDIIKEAIEKIKTEEVSIVIGSENEEFLLKDYSIISLDLPEEITIGLDAKLSVIGPKRVDYSKVIATFKLVGERLKNILSIKKERKEEDIDGK